MNVVKLSLWSDEMKNKIIQGNGSVQSPPGARLAVDPKNLPSLHTLGMCLIPQSTFGGFQHFNQEPITG
jgi:hypothetical protein